MQQENRQSESEKSKKDPSPRGPMSMGLYPEKHQHAEESKSTNYAESAEEEVDRFLRALVRWFLVRLFQARFTEIANLIVGIAIFIVAIVAACIYGGQLEEMRKATEAANNSAKAAKLSAETAMATQRPWLQVKMKLAQDLVPYDKGDVLTVDVSVSNIGLGVANDVQSTLKTEVPLTILNRSAPSSPHRPDVFEAAGELGNWCKTLKPNGRFTDSFFPSDKRFVPPWTLNITDIQMKQSGIGINGLSRFSLLVFGCVSYRYGDFPEWHHTGIVYELDDVSVPGSPAFLIQRKRYGINELSLHPFQFYSQYSD